MAAALWILFGFLVTNFYVLLCFRHTSLSYWVDVVTLVGTVFHFLGASLWLRIITLYAKSDETGVAENI